MKKCQRCGETKQESEFGTNRTRKDGLSHWCKLCRRNHNHSLIPAVRAAEIVRHGIAKAKRRNQIRTLLFEYLADHPCVDCGEADPIVLEFDHVRGEKRFSVSNYAFRIVPSWEKLLTEIDKCDVRCANCHRRKTARQLGWHASVVWQTTL